MGVLVIGAGSWGSALAVLLAKKGMQVCMVTRSSQNASNINSKHKNLGYLNDIEFPENICATTTIDGAFTDGIFYSDSLPNGASQNDNSHNGLCGCASGDNFSTNGNTDDSASSKIEAVVVATPSFVLRDVATSIKNSYIPAETPILICSKGIEQNSGMLTTHVFQEVLGDIVSLAVLSGPNHAEEVVQGIPAGSVIASDNAQTAKMFQVMFATSTFRTYTSADVVGVQLCAAFKNVIALAVGMAYGVGYGDNTASLIITRGIAEMNRLIEAAGGNVHTALGLAGVGDMIATCMSKHSRNRTFGEQFAKGVSLDEYTQRTHMVVEGANACKAMCVLAEKYSVELPINATVNDILWNGVDISSATNLLLRPLKSEFV